MSEENEIPKPEDKKKPDVKPLATPSCSLFCDGDQCVVSYTGSLMESELHIAVWHDAHPEICDACSLQADCDALFGKGGENCKIYAKGNRWQKITKEQQMSLQALLSDI
jgi:hypothetical protein